MNLAGFDDDDSQPQKPVNEEEIKASDQKAQK
jgi:hypothetical protein